MINTSIASSWRRFAAALIDFVVLAVLFFLIGWVASVSKDLASVLIIAMGLLGLTYQIFLHAKYGQTVGKALLSIRVVRSNNGARIQWPEALRRNSVDIAFVLVWLCLVPPIVWSLPSEAFASQGWSNLFNEHLKSQLPKMLETLDNLSLAWVMSEFVTMFFNKRRRALHDYLAGTVVVHEKKNQD
jgi:uncharacterized RDD family membrane protein YckC